LESTIKGGDKMDRKDLREKLYEAFEDNIRELPDSRKKILLDDLLTAFENRKKVLIRTI